MDNRLIFLYFMKIVKGYLLIALPASVTARWYVCEEGYFYFRSGVTEREDQSVCIDWT